MCYFEIIKLSINCEVDIILTFSCTNNYPIEALLNWKAFPSAKFVLLNNNNNYNNDNNNNNNLFL